METPAPAEAASCPSRRAFSDGSGRPTPPILTWFAPLLQLLPGNAVVLMCGGFCNVPSFLGVLVLICEVCFQFLKDRANAINDFRGFTNEGIIFASFGIDTCFRIMEFGK